MTDDHERKVDWLEVAAIAAIVVLLLWCSQRLLLAGFAWQRTQ